ncbi:tRNA lysidine(34) synthetase TilS [Psychrobacter aestuarii]|uniref:tRNA(Ile)-lysidine synthase n=1 Tax=Psychrobacter aestuarii TaxID=556327 RepID=A0ABN0VK45_9GAMM|nr:tRNA lysidine(34) synthetase TilS [Psychrobacter aestuarii]
MQTDTTIMPYPVTVSGPDTPLSHPLAAALLTSIDDYHPQLRGRRVWLACSGGRDSMALAAVCAALYRQGALPFLPQLLHVDHGIQAVSKTWATHVQAWAEAQGLSCHILRAQVFGDNEQAARTARYHAMQAHLRQDDVLMLAHHSDDQAETLLMRLIQGAGVQGLAGMQPWRVQEADTGRYQLWRPWLGVRRAALSRYAECQQLPYINDPTNDTGDNQRSQLRRDIMPALTALNPQAIDNITRSAALLRDAADTVQTQAKSDIAQALIDTETYPPYQRGLSVSTLQALPRARLRQCLHTWLTLDEPLPPPKQYIDDVGALVVRRDANHQTALYWQASERGYHVRRYQDTLYRLDSAWLSWLALPITSQRLLLNHSTQTQSIILRADSLCRWQVRVQATAEATNSTLHIQALTRDVSVKTTRMNHPQRGKKLYQRLGIPMWLRGSIAIISMTDTDGHTTPIALISPYHLWPLSTKTDAVHCETLLSFIAE